jgi:hypothetical protein
MVPSKILLENNLLGDVVSQDFCKIGSQYRAYQGQFGVVGGGAHHIFRNGIKVSPVVRVPSKSKNATGFDSWFSAGCVIATAV